MAKLNAIELAAEIVTSFISNNSVPRGELPALIEAVHAAVARLLEGGEIPAAPLEPPTPAVPIRKSITPDYLICLEDGKRFKSLRRHLATLGMTPDEYRAKWDLPSSYPMVAPNYAAQRSDLAKKIGLGQLRGKSFADLSPEVVESEVVPEPPVTGYTTAVAPTASAGTIEVAAPEPASAGGSEIAVAPPSGIDVVARDEISAGDGEAVDPPPTSVAKSKPRSKKKTAASPIGDTEERKRGRPRKAEA